jgi:hypothetical protein
MHVSINAKGLLPMRRISKQSQVNPNVRVRTVSFQAHAFSDGESIHLKLPGGLVSISSDEKQPSAIPICMPRSPDFSNDRRPRPLCGATAPPIAGAVSNFETYRF